MLSSKKKKHKTRKKRDFSFILSNRDLLKWGGYKKLFHIKALSKKTFDQTTFFNETHQNKAYNFSDFYRLSHFLDIQKKSFKTFLKEGLIYEFQLPDLSVPASYFNSKPKSRDLNDNSNSESDQDFDEDLNPEFDQEFDEDLNPESQNFDEFEPNFNENTFSEVSKMSNDASFDSELSDEEEKEELSEFELSELTVSEFELSELSISSKPSKPIKPSTSSKISKSFKTSKLSNSPLYCSSDDNTTFQKNNDHMEFDEPPSFDLGFDDDEFDKPKDKFSFPKHILPKHTFPKWWWPWPVDDDRPELDPKQPDPDPDPKFDLDEYDPDYDPDQDSDYDPVSDPEDDSDYDSEYSEENDSEEDLFDPPRDDYVSSDLNYDSDFDLDFGSDFDIDYDTEYDSEYDSESNTKYPESDTHSFEHVTDDESETDYSEHVTDDPEYEVDDFEYDMDLIEYDPDHNENMLEDNRSNSPLSSLIPSKGKGSEDTVKSNSEYNKKGLSLRSKLEKSCRPKTLGQLEDLELLFEWVTPSFLETLEKFHVNLETLNIDFDALKEKRDFFDFNAYHNELDSHWTGKNLTSNDEQADSQKKDSQFKPDYFNETPFLELIFYPEYYRLKKPRLTVKQALLTRKTYDADLYIPIQLINPRKDEFFFDWYCVATLPLMTSNGHFIINGLPRVIMSQIVRSPGVYFKKNYRSNFVSYYYSADFIAQRGSWLRLETDIKSGDVWVKMKNLQPIPFFMFLHKFNLSMGIFNLYCDPTHYGKFKQIKHVKKDINLRWILDDHRYLKVKKPLDEQDYKKKSYKKGHVEVIGHQGETDQNNQSLAHLFCSTLDERFRTYYENRTAHRMRHEIKKRTKDLFYKNLTKQFVNIVNVYNISRFNQENSVLTSHLSDFPPLRSKEMIEFPFTKMEKIKLSPTLVPLATSNVPIVRSLFYLFDFHQIIDHVPVPEPYEDMKKKVDNLYYYKFFNNRTYNLSVPGRAKLNQTLGLNVALDCTLLTEYDLLFACFYLLECFEGTKEVSDIDHLKNRKVKPVGELLQNQVAIGLTRFKTAFFENLPETLKTDELPLFKILRKKECHPFSKGWASIANKVRTKYINQLFINGAFREFFASNPLSQMLDQTNPLAEITHKRRLSALGIGGVSRQNAGMDIRSIHPTHYGRICPIETPEGQNAGLVNSLTIYAELNSFGFLQTPFYQTYKGFLAREKGAVLLLADQEKNALIAPADLRTSRFDFLPSRDVPSRQQRTFQRVHRDKIDYMGINPLQMISVATSLIPFLEHNDGNRALMGSNMQRQSVPTVQPTLPIVGTGLESKVISDIDHSLKAHQSGFISYVDSKKICVYSTSEPHWNLQSHVVLQSIKAKENLSLFKKSFHAKLKQPQPPLPSILLQSDLCPLRFCEGKRSKGEGQKPQSRGEQNKKKNINSLFLTNALTKKDLFKDKTTNFNRLIKNAQQPGLSVSTFSQLQELLQKRYYSDYSSVFFILGLDSKQKYYNSKQNHWFYGKNYFTGLLNQVCFQQKAMFFNAAFFCLKMNFFDNNAGLNSNITRQKPQRLQKVTKFRLFPLRFSPSLFPPSLLLQSEQKPQRRGEQSRGLLPALPCFQNDQTSLLPQLTAKQQPIFDSKIFYQNGHITIPKKKKLLDSNKPIYLPFVNIESSLSHFALPFFQNRFNQKGHKVSNVTIDGLTQNTNSELKCASLTLKSYNLNSIWRSNQDTYLLHRPTVSPGQWVEKGDVLADNSASYKGELAIGQNLLVGYTPWEGYNFEDAVLLSNRVLSHELFSSIHVERYEVSVRETPYGFEEITNDLPKNINVFNLDHNGIIKVGSWVTEGDILVGKVAPLKPEHEDDSIPPYEQLFLDIMNEKDQKHKFRNTSLRVPTSVHGRVIHVEVMETIDDVRRVAKKQAEKNVNKGKKRHDARQLKAQAKLTQNQKNEQQQYFKNQKLKKATALTQATYPSSLNLSQNSLKFHFIQPVHKLLNPLYFAGHEVSSKDKEKNCVFFQAKKSTSLEFANNCYSPFLFTHSKNSLRSKRLAFAPFAFLLLQSKQKRGAKARIKKFKKNQKKTYLYSYYKSMLTLGLPHTAILKKPVLKKAGFYKGRPKKPKKVNIYIAETRHLQIGDKIAGRHGNKGIISNILPEQEMPYLQDGTPLDLVLNPLGVPSRMNVGQIFECLLGLAGSYLHQMYKIQPFDEIYGCEASRSLVYSKLYEARIKTKQNWLFDASFPGKVRLFDGRTGQCFEQPVTVGRAYILKLIHLVDEKIHARSTGPYSVVTQQPLRGRSKRGGQRVGEMEVWAFEGFGAAYTLQELLTFKSDDLAGRNDLLRRLLNWKPMLIGPPESFRVLVRELQALCINIEIDTVYTNTKKPISVNLNF